MRHIGWVATYKGEIMHDTLGPTRERTIEAASWLRKINSNDWWETAQKEGYGLEKAYSEVVE